MIMASIKELQIVIYIHLLTFLSSTTNINSIAKKRIVAIEQHKKNGEDAIISINILILSIIEKSCILHHLLI